MAIKNKHKNVKSKDSNLTAGYASRSSSLAKNETDWNFFLSETFPVPAAKSTCQWSTKQCPWAIQAKIYKFIHEPYIKILERPALECFCPFLLSWNVRTSKARKKQQRDNRDRNATCSNKKDMRYTNRYWTNQSRFPFPAPAPYHGRKLLVGTCIIYLNSRTIFSSTDLM